MMKRLALLLAALMRFGCIDQSYYRSAVQGSGVVIDGSGASDLCAQGNCNCMVCDTYLFYGARPTAQFYPFSYKHSECQFVPCTFDQFSSYVQANPQARTGAGTSAASGENMLNFFMFGQGGFGEFNRANPFCNNSLRMPVKWLDSRYGNGEYPMPNVGRAECFLDKGTMPVYILYSNGEHIDASRSREIADELDGTGLHTGPIIITSEMNFNSSNPDTVSNVTEQVRALKSACPECLIALAPRIWDESEELDGIMQEAGDSIDLFAFGIDSNNYTSCSPLLMLSDATQYSQYLLYRYKKPSILAYVLFDNTTSSDGSCTWDDSLISEGYSAFFTYPQGFASSGILGGALYSLYGVADPLGCTDCGLYNSTGSPIPQRQASWFSGCQGAYATSSVVPLVFSDAPGTTCSYSQPGYSFVGSDFRTSPPTYTEPAGSWDTFYSCDSCLVTDRPSSVGKNIRPQLPGDYVCEDYPALDVYADIRDIDPAYVRATVWHESNFQRCSVGNSTAPCGRDEPIFSVTDPGSGCEGDPDWEGLNTYTAPSGHICDMGLIPTFATPEDMWLDINWNSDMEGPGGDLEIARNCAGDEKFNPFNPEHISCEGTYELAEHIRKATSFVEDNEGKLGLTRIKATYGEDEYENSKGLVIVMMARMQFIGAAYGQRDTLASKFSDFSKKDAGYCRDHPGDSPCCEGGRVTNELCCGNNDFVEFVVNEECIDLAGISYGGQKTSVANMRFVLSKYLGVREKCGICDQGAWDENVNAWARTQGVE
ncbi:MAG: hypothetical protein PHQ80_02720 [Candidatus ainarchaeum sp.]|nr:hypothetical protein [Candidatus ainarchaeum sp.]